MIRFYNTGTYLFNIQQYFTIDWLIDWLILKTITVFPFRFFNKNVTEAG